MNYNQAAARIPIISDKPIESVLVDGLVVLKIIKHCQEESGSGSGSEAKGALLGLVKDRKLEVTNCFPYPRPTEEDESDEIEQYQSVMVKHFRNVNVDHLMVGWYQGSPFGSSKSRFETVDTQEMYQEVIEESVVLMYDPIRTQRGFLSLKAFRLTDAAMKLCKAIANDTDNSDSLRNSRMSFDKFYEEIPIKIKNSQLVSALLCELEEEMPVDEGKQFLDLGLSGTLEKSVQSLMKCVEDVSKSANNQRQLAMRKQHVLKENMNRQMNNLPPLTEEEVARMLKIPRQSVERLDLLLTHCQTLNYCNQAANFAAQNIGKLYLSKSLHTPPK